MFNDICNLCLSGQTINNLKKSYETNKNSSYFLIILSDNFCEDDIINFKQLLKIKFLAIRADVKLACKWNQLMEEFGPSKLNNIVFLTDKKGKIISLMNPRGQDKFFSLIGISQNEISHKKSKFGKEQKS